MTLSGPTGPLSPTSYTVTPQMSTTANSMLSQNFSPKTRS